jgi:acetyl esterase/lipase
VASGSPTTFIYKTVHDCQIKADVWGPTTPGPRPVLVWIHGGALIMGQRSDLMPAHRDAYLAAGYGLVAIDYRLAPETKLPAIVQDVGEALAWVRQGGPRLCAADPERIAVIGHSAGGYLALMAGARVRPAPRAVVSFYGYGDILGEWYTRPDPFYCQQSLVTEEEAYGSVGQSCISGAAGLHGREKFYLYCRQQGSWPREVGGKDPDEDAEFFRGFCPIRHVTKEYPPTLLLHGEADSDVPCEQSVAMAKALEVAGVEHELVTIPGGEHGFDHAEGSSADLALERVLRFLARCV